MNNADRGFLKWLLAMGAAALLGGGCQSRGPRSDWQRRFAEVGAGDAIIFRTEGEPVDEAEALPDPLTIQWATREALRCSPEIQAALAKVRAAEADVDQARLLPNPIVSLVVRFRHESPVVTPSVTEDLIAILRRPAAMSAADKRLRVATAGAIVIVLATAAEAQQTYLAVRAVDDELAILGERKKLIDRLGEVARSRKQAGEGTRLDVLTLEAQALQLEVSIADKELERSQNRLTLAKMLGRPSAAADWALGRWDPPPTVAGSEAEYLRAALAARPEIQSKLWELSALGDEATLARWGVWDGVLVGAEAERDITWSGGPAVAGPLPLFDLGGAKRDKVIAEVIGARHELSQTRREVIEAVRKAYVTYVRAQHQLAQVRDRLSPLQEQRRASAEAAYRAGETDLTTLLIAEQDLQETREKLVELREKAAVAYVTLQKVTAGGRVTLPATTRPTTAP